MVYRPKYRRCSSDHARARRPSDGRATMVWKGAMRVRRRSGSWRYSSDFLGIEFNCRPKRAAMHRLQKHGSVEQNWELPTEKAATSSAVTTITGKIPVDQAAPLK